MTPPLIRPMGPDDLDAAEEISGLAFRELDLRALPPGAAEPPMGASPGGRRLDRAEKWRLRTAHLLGTDPGGCWVAEVDGVVVGFATSAVRELMWVLSTYAVRPGWQGRGIGRVLLEAALHHGRGCLRGMLNASSDPLALRRYHAAGFTLHPQLSVRGQVVRSALDESVLDETRHVREGVPGDLDLMDSVDRRTRGAAHGPDHVLLSGLVRFLVTDRPGSSGYAYVDATGSPLCLAATSRRAATALTWEALASSSPDVEVEIDHVHAANDWAIDVAMSARLEITAKGFWALRRMKPPAPYLPHPTFS